MKIKNIIEAAAVLLGKENITAYLSGGGNAAASAETLSEVNEMTGLCNLMLNELAGSYMPMVCTESIAPTDRKLYFSALNRRVVRIRNFYDVNDNALFYIMHAEYAVITGDAVSIEYEYLPENYGLTSDIGYTERDVSVSVLSYGLAAEVCLAEARFKEAVMWRERYSEGIASFTVPKNGRIKSRCWL